MFVSMFIGALIALYIKPEIVPYIGTYDMVTNEPILIQDRHILGNLFRSSFINVFIMIPIPYISKSFLSLS